MASEDDRDNDQDRPGLLEYFNYPVADRLKMVKDQIRKHEEKHFELTMAQMSVEGNPEQGTHQEPDPRKTGDQPPCMCGGCELERIENGLQGLTYAINRLKALCNTLT